jgi:hypothetical protein
MSATTEDGMADQHQSRFFDSTIYHRKPGNEESTVGITFKPTPSLTKDEMRQLVHDLCLLAMEMHGEALDVDVESHS